MVLWAIGGGLGAGTTVTLVIQILNLKRVFALGRLAKPILSTHFAPLAASYLRHPSNGE